MKAGVNLQAPLASLVPTSMTHLPGVKVGQITS